MNKIMTKQEFLAASLPYGLKLMQLRKHYPTPQKDRVVTLDGIADICGLLPSVIYNNEAINFYTVFYRVDESTSGSDSDIQFIPIVRSLNTLVKECVQKDYNNGKPFVPIVELLKNSSFDTSKMSEEEIMSFVKVYSNTDLIALNDLPLYLQWHFDLFGGIESGEAIDVNTLDINPYK